MGWAAEDDYDATYGKAQAKIRRRLKDELMAEATMGTKAGEWSARKSQELKRRYEAACERKGLKPYKGEKTAKQKDLSDWSDQDWRTSSGGKSSVTGEPYFPAKAVEALKERDLYAKAKRQKAAATRAGKQRATYSDDIRAVVARYRAEYVEPPMDLEEEAEARLEAIRQLQWGLRVIDRMMTEGNIDDAIAFTRATVDAMDQEEAADRDLGLDPDRFSAEEEDPIPNHLRNHPNPDYVAELSRRYDPIIRRAWPYITTTTWDEGYQDDWEDEDEWREYMQEKWTEGWSDCGICTNGDLLVYPADAACIHDFALLTRDSEGWLADTLDQIIWSKGLNKKSTILNRQDLGTGDEDRRLKYYLEEVFQREYDDTDEEGNAPGDPDYEREGHEYWLVGFDELDRTYGTPEQFDAEDDPVSRIAAGTNDALADFANAHDTDDGFYLIGGLIGGLAIAVAGNILADRVQEWWKGRSSS